MEFIFHDINTAFYIYIKIPNATFINYAPPTPLAPVCVRNVPNLSKKKKKIYIGRMIGIEFPTKAKTSHINEHSLFIYCGGSNIERYILTSIPHTRRS
jgi:hypothetical protein